MMFDGSWAPSLKGSDGGPLSDFIEGLGPGQLVGRQVLGSPSLGDIQLSMCYQKGYLEVEVIRARGLQARPGSKVLPGNFNVCLTMIVLNANRQFNFQIKL